MYNLGSFLLVAILSMLAINSFGQNWLSSSSGTGNIYYNQGNVGIGVTDPQWKLDVNGDINIPFTRKIGYRLHDEFNYDGRVQPHYGLQWVSDTESPGSGTLWQSGYGGIKFFTAGQVRFKIEKNGNVGVGTTKPLAKLDVNGGIASNFQVAVHNPLNRSASVNLNWKDNISRIRVGGENEGAANGLDIQTVGDRSLMRLLHNGNVGIGTTTPDSRLAVNGIIRAKEVKVEGTNWPDYVFGKGYQLMPLDELASYITENGHLPNIPTEADVKQDGLKLAEINAKLLEKVEELTLYLLQQQQINLNQAELIEEQEIRLAKLEKYEAARKVE